MLHRNFLRQRKMRNNFGARFQSQLKLMCGSNNFGPPKRNVPCFVLKKRSMKFVVEKCRMQKFI